MANAMPKQKMYDAAYYSPVQSPANTILMAGIALIWSKLSSSGQMGKLASGQARKAILEWASIALIRTKPSGSGQAGKWASEKVGKAILEWASIALIWSRHSGSGQASKAILE